MQTVRLNLWRQLQTWRPLHVCTLEKRKEKEAPSSIIKNGAKFHLIYTMARSILSILRVSTLHISTESNVSQPIRPIKYIVSKGKLSAIKYEYL